MLDPSVEPELPVHDSVFGATFVVGLFHVSVI